MRKIIFILFIIFSLLILAGAYYVSQLPQGDRFNLANFSPQELYQAGQQKVKEGDFKEAKKYIEAALDKTPGNVTYLGELAAIKYKMEDYAGAISEYQKIYVAGENKGFALNGLGNIYRDQEKFAQAKKNYEQGLAEDSQYIALYQNYALMLVDQNQLEKAKEILKQGMAKTGSQELTATLGNLE